jgi:hypothetical protein
MKDFYDKTTYQKYKIRSVTIVIVIYLILFYRLNFQFLQTVWLLNER